MFEQLSLFPVSISSAADSPVALRDDVPLGLDLAACALGGYDLEGLRAWYEAHGMPGIGEQLQRSPMKRAPTDAQREAWERGDAVVPF